VPPGWWLNADATIGGELKKVTGGPSDRAGVGQRLGEPIVWAGEDAGPG
jgi:hypothetical protein